MPSIVAGIAELLAETSAETSDRRGTRSRVLRALYEVSRAAVRALDEGGIAEAATEQLRRLFKSDTAVLWLWDDGNAKLTRFLSSSSDGHHWARTRLDAGEGMPGQAFVSGQAVVVEDYAAYPHSLPEVAGAGLKSAMAVPLVAGARPVGVVVVGCLKPRHFSAEEAEALVFFGEQLAPVTESLQLRLQLQRRRAEGEALAALARQGVRERDIRKLLSLLAEHTVRLLGADYSAVVAVDARNKIVLRGSFGVRSPGWRTVRIPRSDGATRAALDAGKTLVFENYDQSEFAAARPKHASEGAHTVFVTPLPTREGLAGVLHAGWREDFRPGAEDIRMFDTLAASGAGIIDNAQAHHKADQLAKRLEASINQTKEAAARRELEVERRLALAAIVEALSSATRDVEAMLKIVTRELARGVNATCTVRLLQDGYLHILQGAVYDQDPERQRLIAGLLQGRPVPLRESRYRAVVDTGRAQRWFHPPDQPRRRVPQPVRDLLKRLPVEAVLVAPLRAHGRVLGTIGLYRHFDGQPFTEEDELFVQDVGDRAGLVLENARLFEQLAASRERLEELSYRLVRLQDRERRAIALELHDEVGQGLTAARLLLEAARRLPARLRDERLDEACRTLDEAIAQVRGLSLDLRPPMLDRFGLAPALDAFFDRFTMRTGIQVAFCSPRLSARAPKEVEMAAYRIIQEGLTNVVRHARVDQAEVELWSDKHDLWLRVADTGAGFDATLLSGEASTGLTGMQERAELLGGQLTVESTLGVGTRLEARLPLATKSIVVSG